MKINGIKLGFESKRAFQNYIPKSCDTPVYKILSEQRDNISFMNIDGTRDDLYISCCFTAALGRQADSITVEQKPVGTVSIFPHHGNLDALGILLDFFSKNPYPVYDVSTSSATITFVTDYIHCLDICKKLADQFELPASHTPFLPMPQSLEDTIFKTGGPETSAEYVEKNIKTYGFNIKSNLDLYCIQTDFKAFSTSYNHKAKNNTPAAKFHFACGHMAQNNRFRLFFICDHTRDDVPWVVLPSQKYRADLVFFQGPHFGDRYGIANKAISLLAAAKQKVLLAGFTGACIYMVLPENSAENAVHSLLEGFTTP